MQIFRQGHHDTDERGRARLFAPGSRSQPPDRTRHGPVSVRVPEIRDAKAYSALRRTKARGQQHRAPPQRGTQILSGRVLGPRARMDSQRTPAPLSTGDPDVRRSTRRTALIGDRLAE